VFPDDGADVQTLLRNADIAMYKSKQAGKNRLHFYAPQMQVDVAAHLEIQAELRKAIATEAFVLEYQPIIDADSGELAGAEALIRWQHPERGRIAPAEFIPIAEECGLIVAIGEWALRAAATQWRSWYDAGADLRLAVNVSGMQFRDASLPPLVAEVIRECGIVRGALVLEICESVLMDGSVQAQARMREIKEQGIGYALDDFGTGFSSLSYLKRFPVDVVKIDRSFVSGCPDDRNDAHLVEAIINMTHSLGLKVVAEGVETEAQRNFLRALGCDQLQGYLIGKPMSAEAFLRLIEARAARPATVSPDTRSEPA
jgi:EAL domain-containing protein (putative c-di-GMP-specific phosphodiesterase class I)